MSQCKDCRWWESSNRTVGTCALLGSDPVFGIGHRAVAAAKNERDAAILITAHDFGCNDFAEKPLEETVSE